MVETSSSRRHGRVIRRVLVANRGEIASRVFRTCRALGKDTVAIYSEADRDLPFVRESTVAFCVGPAPATESYLSIPAILNAARATHADAIHPGYGFLSENSDFAQAVKDAGLHWVGPEPESINKIGNKRSAKELIGNNLPNVPLVPGYYGKEQDPHFLAKQAEKIGFPLLLKASGGGGGKGMRVVRQREDLVALIESAQGEGLRSFANSELILERYFEHSKHIEVQIFGDIQGNVVSLGTRECSMQRRHQKVIEEAPAPSPYSCERQTASSLNGEASMMEKCAVQIGELISYVGAGTVEFLVDGDTGKFYFLEVNTRLQVEHTVTEQITGLDLVALQICVAEGGELSRLLREAPNVTRGLHSIQCRLYAEDPGRDFAPCAGKILKWIPWPLNDQNGQSPVRYESSVETGTEVGIFYDPMICKIITTGRNRQEAIHLMQAALQNTICLGITNNCQFLIELLSLPSFHDGSHLTCTIGEFLKGKGASLLRQVAFPDRLGHTLDAIEVSVAASTAWNLRYLHSTRRTLRHLNCGWTNMPLTILPQTQWSYLSGGNASYWATHQPLDKYSYAPPKTWRIKIDKSEDQANIQGPKYEGLDAPELSGVVLVSILHEAWPARMTLSINSIVVTFHFARVVTVDSDETEYRLWVQSPAMPFSCGLAKLRKLRSKAAHEKADDNDYRANMPCRILRVAAKSGQEVKKGELLLVIESMKMETRIHASHGGVVQLRVKEGALVDAGVILVQVVPKS